MSSYEVCFSNCREVMRELGRILNACFGVTPNEIKVESGFDVDSGYGTLTFIKSGLFVIVEFASECAHLCINNAEGVKDVSEITDIFTATIWRDWDYLEKLIVANKCLISDRMNEVLGAHVLQSDDTVSNGATSYESSDDSHIDNGTVEVQSSSDNSKFRVLSISDVLSSDSRIKDIVALRCDGKTIAVGFILTTGRVDMTVSKLKELGFPQYRIAKKLELECRNGMFLSPSEIRNNCMFPDISENDNICRQVLSLDWVQ